MGDSQPPRLFPSQACFVVDDVAAAVAECTARFGWGPFQQFTAPVADAQYRGWRGRKVTDVALGMAGRVQVELIHVREGHDAVAAYQARYGRGFQHLGIGCRSREAALRHLEGLGAELNEELEYDGVRIAFVDVPTGPAMFELLQAGAEAGAARETGSARTHDTFAVDRATIVTRDIEAALGFYAAAFGWTGTGVEAKTLRFGGDETRVHRFRGRAGALELELIEPRRGGNDPYALHLARGDHGLIHAGGPLPTGRLPEGAVLHCEWAEDAEAFALYDWAGGAHTLQWRRAGQG